MSVTIQFPPEVEERLKSQCKDLAADVREAAALGLFRQGKLSHFELSQILGLDRFETDGYLKRHNVFEGSLTAEDLDEQYQALEKLLGPVRT